MAQQFSFLESFLKDLLDQHGFSKLSEEDQESYLPQFVAEAEKRLGVALLPYLKTETAAAEFEALLQKDASAEEWSAFWQRQVPDFQQVATDALADFAKEVGTAFSQ